MQTFESPDLEIREAVARYLERKIDVDKLHNTIAHIMYGDDPPDVASEVALTLAEYHRGDRTDEEVRRLLTPVVTHITLQYPLASTHARVTQSSSGSTRYEEAPSLTAAG